jgi:Sec-independent protein translocase protein TatA
MNMQMGENGGMGKISELIANIESGLAELKGMVSGEEQGEEQPTEEEPVEGSEAEDAVTPPMPMKSKMGGALSRFSGRGM